MKRLVVREWVAVSYSRLLAAGRTVEIIMVQDANKFKS
jgi:hypothetical protein